MYYEVHPSQSRRGQVPLILLHGGGLSTDSFGGILPALSANRDVIAVDLQAHGRTGDIDRPLSYQSMAEDVAALAGHLGAGRIDAMGYSLGGGVALRVAVQNPDLVRKLVVVSTPCRRDGWYPEIQEAMSKPIPHELMKQSPMFETYARVAPRPQDWGVLFTKLQQMLARDYDWTEEVATIQAQTMIVFGDADSVRPAHVVEFFERLGGGQKDAGWDGSGMPAARLAILPGTTHYNMLESSLLPTAVTEFLDRSAPAGK